MLPLPIEPSLYLIHLSCRSQSKVLSRNLSLRKFVQSRVSIFSTCMQLLQEVKDCNEACVTSMSWWLAQSEVDTICGKMWLSEMYIKTMKLKQLRIGTKQKYCAVVKR